jgi:hypothetical protein
MNDIITYLQGIHPIEQSFLILPIIVLSFLLVGSILVYDWYCDKSNVKVKVEKGKGKEE